MILLLPTLLAQTFAVGNLTSPGALVPECSLKSNYYKIIGPLSNYVCRGENGYPRTVLTGELHELTSQPQMIRATGFSDLKVISVSTFVESSDFVQAHNYLQGDLEIYMPDFSSPCAEAGYVTAVSLGGTNDFEVSPTNGLKLSHNSIDPIQTITAHCSTSSAYVDIHYVSDFKMAKIIP